MFGLLFACCILLVELLIIYPRVQFGLLCKVHSDIHRKHIGWNPLNSDLVPIILNFPWGGGGWEVLNTTRKRPCLQHISILAAITIEAFNTSL